MAAEAGRGPIPVTIFGSSADPAVLEGYRDAGVARVVLGLPSAPAAKVLPILDRWAALMRKVG